jgi:predicted nucleic acid-binding protein
MIFTGLVAGATVFVDANTLVYHFTHHPRYGPPCTALLDRIERQEISGCTATPVLSEASHRMMTLEAITLFGWPQANVGNRLRTNPAEVGKLATFRKAIDRVLQSNLRVLTVAPSLLGTGAALCQQLGLLTNDGLIVAVMQANGLTNIASNDADFDRVPGLTRYAPV